MERKFLGNVALFLLLLSGLFTISAWAQTTDEGSGPSEQPSAPMEMGQPQSAPPPPPQAGQPDSRLSPVGALSKTLRWSKKLSPADPLARVQRKSIRASVA